MNKLSLLFYIFIYNLVYFNAQAQQGEWVWLHGDSTFTGTGNWGIQGVPSPTNEPPSLYAACQWTDHDGNFWLFGGVQSTGNEFGDLWKY